MTEVPTYTPIRISTLRGDRPIGFDVFVKIGPRFVAYCRRGTTFEGERLERLTAKNLKELYIHVLDQMAYESYLNESVEAAYRPGQPLKTRCEVIAGFQQAASERFMENPLDENAYKAVRNSAQRFVDFLIAEPFAVGAILGFANTSLSVPQHAVNVATLAVAIALKQGAPDGTPVGLLALGCLLHDIDHFRSARDVGRRPDALAPEERAAYREHPLRGVKMLSEASFVDQLVVSIVGQHEETMDGSGYPRGLTADEMDPLVLVAGLANAYDRLVSFDRMQPRDALKHLLIDKMGEYSLESMKTLQGVLKLHEVV